MKVFVTGAAGFIGSHTTEALLDRGYEVVGLDNFNDYYDPAQKRRNQIALAAHGRSENLSLHEGDLRDVDLLNTLFAQHRFDAIVHLAAMAGVRYSIEHPHLYFDVNLTGTLNLLELAKKHGNPNFVFASTSSAYGETDRIPFVEDDPSAKPRAPYPASKRAAELLGYTYHHLSGMDFTALRFFTVYGPRNRPDMMAYKVAESVFFGKQVPLFNGGQMWRDWTYVKDIVAGVVNATERRLGYEIVNIGRGEPVLLSEFVAKVEVQAGGKATFADEPMPNADVSRTYASIEKAQRLLAYEPTTSVDEGIAAFLEWFKATVVR